MSYSKSLDEYSETELIDEMERRASLRRSGKCDYCEQAQAATPCRYLARHTWAEADPLSETKRGEGGFGSTGTR